MKSTLFVLGALATGAALSAQTDSAPRSFFNVSLAYAFLGDLDDTEGFAVNAGSSFAGPHGWEVSGAHFDSGFLGETTKLTPLLAGYRYTYVDGTSFSCYASALTGVTLLKFTESPLLSTGPRQSESDQAFSFGGKLGFEWHFSKHWSLDTSYTLLRLQESDLNGSGNISYVAAALNYRF